MRFYLFHNNTLGRRQEKNAHTTDHHKQRQKEHAKQQDKKGRHDAIKENQAQHNVHADFGQQQDEGLTELTISTGLSVEPGRDGVEDNAETDNGPTEAETTLGVRVKGQTELDKEQEWQNDPQDENFGPGELVILCFTENGTAAGFFVVVLESFGKELVEIDARLDVEERLVELL